MNRFSIISGLGIVFLLLASFGFANVVTTTMTWVVANTKSISIAYTSPCTSSAFFFVETTALFDPDSDGNGAKVAPQGGRAAGDANCQTSAVAPVLITNNGTGDVNVDGNFAASLSGNDVNIVLKVWLGSTGCGGTGANGGYGGWEARCTSIAPFDTVTAPTTSACRSFDNNNWTTGARIITNLTRTSAQQLCFSGDFNVLVPAGDHNGNFQIGSQYS